MGDQHRQAISSLQLPELIKHCHGHFDPKSQYKGPIPVSAEFLMQGIIHP